MIKSAAISAFILVGVVGLTAFGIDRFYGVEIQQIIPKNANVMKLERAMWSKGDPVIPLYGMPAGKLMRIVVWDQSSVISPKEDTSLRLLPVNKQKGDNPLQVKTVWFFAYFAMGGLALAGFLGLGLGEILKRRKSMS